jgi:hypothetical protein
MKYYLKNGIKNRVPYSDGVSIPFEPRSDGRGLLVLDENSEADKPRIADVEKYIARKVGGISVLTQEQYEELKKNQHDPKPKQDKAAPRVFSYKTDPFATEASAQRAMAPEPAAVAAGRSPVGSVGEPGSSEPDPKAAIVAQGPKSKGRPAVRTNKAKAADIKPEAPAVTEPISGLSSVAQSVEEFVNEPEPSTPTPSAAGSNETTAPAE